MYIQSKGKLKLLKKIPARGFISVHTSKFLASQGFVASHGRSAKNVSSFITVTLLLLLKLREVTVVVLSVNKCRIYLFYLYSFNIFFPHCFDLHRIKKIKLYFWFYRILREFYIIFELVEDWT